MSNDRLFTDSITTITDSIITMILDLIKTTLVFSAPIFVVFFLAMLIAKVATKDSRLKNIAKLLNNVDINAQSTPKSLSGGDSLFISKILKNYPQFDLEQAKNEIELCVKNIFTSIQNNNVESVENKYNYSIVAATITLSEKYNKENITELNIHKTAISNYIKSKNAGTVKFQVAFQFTTNSGNPKIIQGKYEFDYISNTGDDSKEATGVRCSYCGAPINNLENENCEYCGNYVISLLKNWQISDIKIF